MHLNHYDYETVIAYPDGTKGVRADITASDAPATFPATAEGMTGKFPTRNAADTKFLPGSTIMATKTGGVWVLNPDGDWDAL